MKKAVIYARFSSHSQNEQSIEGQTKACYEFAERNGYTVIREYIDRAISGTAAENRPEFQHMIEDSNKKQFQFVLVYQLDRFARNRYDSATYKAKLKKNDVKVLSARENISDDASGVLMEAVLEGMAEYFSRELSQKIKRGREINASKFLSLGSRVGLGLKVEDRNIVVDEPNAAHVVRIYEMYANGSTMLDIINYMNSAGVKTAKGNEFRNNSLQTILRNKRYCGIYTYKGTETPNALPRIISQDLWDRVQKRLIGNKGAGGRGKAVEDFILSSKLFCGHCLTPMTGTSGTGKSGKLHSYYKEKSNGCKKLTVKKGIIEDKVVSVVRDMLTEENQKIIASEIAALCEQDKDNPNLKRLLHLIKENEQQKINLLESLKVGKASASAANYVFSELDKIDKEIVELEKQANVEEDRHYKLSEIDIMYFLSKIKKGSVNLDDIETRKLLVNTLVNSIYVYEDDNGGHNLTIVFNASNQPPVTVDIALLDEIKEQSDGCSYTSRLAPPTLFKLLEFKSLWILSASSFK